MVEHLKTNVSEWWLDWCFFFFLKRRWFKERNACESGNKYKNDAFVKGGVSDSGERPPNKYCPLQFDPCVSPACMTTGGISVGGTQQSADSHCLTAGCCCWQTQRKWRRSVLHRCRSRWLAGGALGSSEGWFMLLQPKPGSVWLSAKQFQVLGVSTWRRSRGDWLKEF